MPEPEAAVAILHTSGPYNAVLLIRRSEREADSWSGHWSFPGGRRDPGDRDLLDTALRELEEECAIRLAREHMERALPPIVARRQVGPFVVVAPFLFRMDSQPVAVPDPSEAVEARWIPLNTIVDPTQHSLRPVRNWPPEMLFPAIDLNGIPLWGFTYRLLTIWLDLTTSHRVLPAFQLASSVLEFLVGRGLGLQHGWALPVTGRRANGEKVVQVAAVKGRIPVAAVLAHFAKPVVHVPLVNCLEVQANYIRVLGLNFEAYVIHASD